MHRPHGDPDSPPASQSAWLWHDLALALRIEPLAPSPALHQRIETLVLGAASNETPQSADELSRMGLRLSEGAPDLRARAFWQIVAGFGEALARDDVKPTPESQRLLTQIFQQYIRYQQEPNGDAIDELLCHDLLAVCLEVAPPEQAVVLPRIHEAYTAQPLPELNLIWPAYRLDDEGSEAVVSEPKVSAPEVSESDTSGPLVPEKTDAPSALPLTAPHTLALTQLRAWSDELAQVLNAWVIKPSRPLPPTALVLPRVMAELMASQGLQEGAATASALLAALGRAQQAIGLLPMQAKVLAEAAQALHNYLSASDLKLVQLPGSWLETLQDWPPPVTQHPDEAAEPAEVEHAPVRPVKVQRPMVAVPDAPRLLYFSSILPRLQKALPQGQVVLRDAGVALVRTDLQALAGLLDQLIAHLYQRAKNTPLAAPALRVHTLPAYGRLGVQLTWQIEGAEVSSTDDVPTVQAGPSDAAWQAALEAAQASWDGAVLSLPVQHLSCRVRRLRAGDLSFALVDEGDALQAGDGLGDAWALRHPPAKISEVLESQEVLMAAPSPVMRRLPGVVGVLPKTGGGLPVLIYRAATRRP